MGGDTRGGVRMRGTRSFALAARLGRLALQRAGTVASAGLAAGLALVERGSTIRSAEGLRGAALGPRVGVFVQYDPTGAISAPVRHYVSAMRDAGLAVVLVCNGPPLRADAAGWARGMAATVIQRRNLGYDFAGWRDALAWCGLPAPGLELLVVANDSVYGPFAPFAELIAALDFTRADVWGATESWQIRYHLQSYLLFFGPAALAHPAFQAFWPGVQNYRSKRLVIRNYEIGLTRALLAAGLRCEALWPYAAVADAVQRIDPADPQIDRLARRVARQDAFNPASDAWRVLVAQGFPFLKRQLLLQNPSYVADLALWRIACRSLPAFDETLVLDDLKRRMRRRAP